MHIARDAYVKRNIEKITQVANPADFVIKSFVLTSEGSTFALYRRQITIPFVFFHPIEKEGVKKPYTTEIE